MAYYLHVGGDRSGLGAWEINETHVRRIDGANVEYPRSLDVDVIKNIESTVPFSKVYELRLRPGEYYPRMARPSNAYPNESPGNCPDNRKNQNLISEALGQLGALKEQLERICRVVHPVPATFSAYGHEIRNLLILACTEVETQWKGVLKAHNAKAKSTKEYVKLAPALKLPEYRVSFPFYPWLAPFRPFENWTTDSDTPTKDLPWYDAYNAVKHDRENEFSRATLENTLQVVAAYVVMMCAQFGWHFSIGEREELRSYFEMTSVPSWEPTDVYTPLLSQHVLEFTTPLTYRFSNP